MSVFVTALISVRYLAGVRFADSLTIGVRTYLIVSLPPGNCSMCRED
jgi:hypothetical protein